MVLKGGTSCKNPRAAGCVATPLATHIIVIHRFLHQHALASRTLSPALKEILFASVNVVNFIRALALNHHIFKRLCKEMGAQHEVLLYHTKICWLSRGQVLKR